MQPSPESIPACDDTAAPPEWTPEQQMAHMLGLCEAQMESALAESDQAVDALIRAFTGLDETTRSLGKIAEDLPREIREKIDTKLNEQIRAIQDQMASAVVAFQFYDKLTQRLGHVRYSLTSLAMFVCNRAQTSQREQWQRLFSTLRRLYRTEEEREIFQLMVKGASAEDARAQAEQHTLQRAANQSGDIELF
jgi:uncharacterized tellurite resistance protein B-like protein